MIIDPVISFDHRQPQCIRPARIIIAYESPFA